MFPPRQIQPSVRLIFKRVQRINLQHISCGVVSVSYFIIIILFSLTFIFQANI